MKIETTPQDDHQIKIEAEFESELFDSFKRRASKKITKQAKIPGFRPGKAPYDVIVRMYGEGVINEEAIELLIDEQYSNVLEEASITPSGPGSLQEIISMDPLKLSFLVPLQPEVELGDYKSVELSYSPEPVTDEEIKEFLAKLQKNYATAEPVERPAAEGDLAYFQLTGHEGDELVLEETPIQFVIGDSDQNDNWPYENFSHELIGVKEGEEKVIDYTFGEDSTDEKFKGKTIKFTINVQSIKSMKLPELDDEFAKSLGQFENYEELDKAVREQQEATKKQEYDEKFYSELMAKFGENATVKFPPFMVNEEIEHMLKTLERDLKQQSLDFETYLKLMNTDKEKYIEDNVRPAAINRVKNSLIIEKFAKEEKIEVSKEEVDNIVNDTMQMMSNMPDQKGKKQKVSSDMVNNVAYNAISRLYNQKTLDRMKAMASGETEVVDSAVEEAEEDKEKGAKASKPKKTTKKATTKKAKSKATAADSEESKVTEAGTEETKATEADTEETKATKSEVKSKKENKKDKSEGDKTPEEEK